MSVLVQVIDMDDPKLFTLVEKSSPTTLPCSALDPGPIQQPPSDLVYRCESTLFTEQVSILFILNLCLCTLFAANIVVLNVPYTHNVANKIVLPE